VFRPKFYYFLILYGLDCHYQLSELSILTEVNASAFEAHFRSLSRPCSMCSMCPVKEHPVLFYDLPPATLKVKIQAL